jgi:hypothetical protein
MLHLIFHPPCVLDIRLSVIYAQVIDFKGWIFTYLKQILLNLFRIYKAMCCMYKHITKVLSLLPFLFVSTSLFYGFLYTRITVCYRGFGKLEEKVITIPGQKLIHSTCTSL